MRENNLSLPTAKEGVRLFFYLFLKIYLLRGSVYLVKPIVWVYIVILRIFYLFIYFLVGFG